jgi:hypothetical protein
LRPPRAAEVTERPKPRAEILTIRVASHTLAGPQFQPIPSGPPLPTGAHVAGYARIMGSVSFAHRAPDAPTDV